MTSDGKTVGFIADLLDQVQSGRIALEGKFVVHVVQIKGLEACLAGNAFGHAKQGQVVEAQFLHHIAGHVQLALAAVHQQYIGQLALAVLDTPVAASQRLMHGGIVITTG